MHARSSSGRHERADAGRQVTQVQYRPGSGHSGARGAVECWRGCWCGCWSGVRLSGPQRASRLEKPGNSVVQEGKQRDWSLARGVVNTKDQMQRHSTAGGAAKAKMFGGAGKARTGTASGVVAPWCCCHSLPVASAMYLPSRYLVALVYPDAESDPGPPTTATARALGAAAG